MALITHNGIGYNGRLGNQLFQFASLFGLSKKSEKEIFILDNVLEPMEETLSNGQKNSARFVLSDYFPKVGKFLTSLEKVKNESFGIIHEQSFVFDQNIVDKCRASDNICIAGYFQSPLYFYEYRDELLSLLSFESKKADGGIIPNVSLHVRRGDYLSLSQNHPVCTVEYYNKAIEHFAGCDFTVFSDDIEWCKTVFPDTFKFSENSSEENDLKRMSECDHHIMSNSTFSWWGAYLNKNKIKEVVAPSRWFGPGYAQHDPCEILAIATKLI